MAIFADDFGAENCICVFGVFNHETAPALGAGWPGQQLLIGAAEAPWWWWRRGNENVELWRLKSTRFRQKSASDFGRRLRPESGSQHFQSVSAHGSLYTSYTISNLD